MKKVEHLIAPPPGRLGPPGEDTVTIRDIADKLVSLTTVCAAMEHGFTSQALFLDHQRQWKNCVSELAAMVQAMKTRAMRAGR